MVRKKIKKSEPETVEKLQQTIREIEENWKRALADYQNLEKRINEHKRTYTHLANASLIDKLLGVLDDLNRAQEHLQNEGVGLILTRFNDILSSEGVEEIPAQDLEFNPETMDCQEMARGPKNMVVAVRLKGYKLNNQVLRPAKVVVGRGK